MKKQERILAGLIATAVVIGAAWWWRNSRTVQTDGGLVSQKLEKPDLVREPSLPSAPVSPKLPRAPAQPARSAVSSGILSEPPPIAAIPPFASQAPRSEPATPPTKTAQPPASSPPGSSVSSGSASEIAGTEHMLAAHVSLRAPAVADPDSPQNRQVLQTMVLKALSRVGEGASAQKTPH